MTRAEEIRTEGYYWVTFNDHDGCFIQYWTGNGWMNGIKKNELSNVSKYPIVNTPEFMEDLQAALTDLLNPDIDVNISWQKIAAFNEKHKIV